MEHKAKHENSALLRAVSLGPVYSLVRSKNNKKKQYLFEFLLFFRMIRLMAMLLWVNTPLVVYPAQLLDHCLLPIMLTKSENRFIKTMPTINT